MKPLLRRAIPLVLVSTAVNAFAGSATWKQFPVSNNWNLANNWSFIAGIYNIAEPVASGIKPVYINSTGQLGTTPPASSRRFKEAIKPMDKSSEAILGLTPVTFRYKSDSESTPQFGLIAEEVAKVNPDLVVRDDKGEIYTVRYDAVNAMLLNEFLKAHGQIEQQTRRIEELTAPASIANSEGKRRRCTGQICTANDCDETVRPSHQPLLINSGPGRAEVFVL